MYHLNPYLLAVLCIKNKQVAFSYKVFHPLTQVRRYAAGSNRGLRPQALVIGFVLAMVCLLRCLGGAVFGRWTCDRKVAGSTPGRGVIKSTRSTQPFIPLGSVNRVPACMAGVKAGVCSLVSAGR